MRVALATCRRLPEPDPDAAPLLAALRSRGIDAAWLAWDDDAVDWSAYDACVLRSTWDYIHRLDAFLAWTERVARATRLFNPAPLVRWNADKRYLEELERRGIAVIPTVYVDRGSPFSLATLREERGWEDVVIKPCVGAASFETRRFAPSQGEEARRFLAARVAERDMLVQPYLRSVSDVGERALVWVSGELTHAIRKSPRLAGEDESVSGALPVQPDEAAFAAAALEPYRGGLLYARVDVARDEEGGLRLMELELIEPSLFLAQNPRALGRLAGAIVGLGIR